jgi:hypothetical protein
MPDVPQKWSFRALRLRWDALIALINIIRLVVFVRPAQERPYITVLSPAHASIEALTTSTLLHWHLPLPKLANVTKCPNIKAASSL